MLIGGDPCSLSQSGGPYSYVVKYSEGKWSGEAMRREERIGERSKEGRNVWGLKKNVAEASFKCVEPCFQIIETWVISPKIHYRSKVVTKGPRRREKSSVRWMTRR